MQGENVMRIEPYLYFNGRCEEAFSFYRAAIGAEVIALMRFKDIPGAHAPKGAEEKVSHGNVRIGDSTVLASDGECHGSTNFQGFSLSLTATKDSEAERQFAALSDGGRVQLPMMTTPFASRFGMVTDRFGVLWTIVTEEKPASAKA
jgi:PhnB protein